MNSKLIFSLNKEARILLDEDVEDLFGDASDFIIKVEFFYSV
jgi:hypothetical protein